jgi:hypothetical protein
MASLQSYGSAADIPLLIKSTNAESERRVNPSWTIAHFKSRLEPITGVPSSTQKLSFRIASQDAVPIEAANEEAVQLSAFGLQPYAEVTVSTHTAFHGSLSQSSPRQSRLLHFPIFFLTCLTCLLFPWPAAWVGVLRHSLLSWIVPGIWGVPLVWILVAKGYLLSLPCVLSCSA